MHTRKKRQLFPYRKVGTLQLLTSDAISLLILAREKSVFGTRRCHPRGCPEVVLCPRDVGAHPGTHPWDGLKEIKGTHLSDEDSPLTVSVRLPLLSPSLVAISLIGLFRELFGEAPTLGRYLPSQLILCYSVTAENASLYDQVSRAAFCPTKQPKY
ncbi:hypothetical protein RUM43_012637 [Polyplax serrata]|uniref:Uncharacterized protein n=1 Tax=Polyplax serrata TaxID=468196 RepID=A0AAN8S6F5_POLSC